MAGWRYVLPVTRSSAAFVLSVIRLTVPDLEFLILSVFLPQKKFRGRRASPLENGCGKNITQLLKRIIAKLPLDYSGFQLPFIQKIQKNTAEWRCIF